MQPTSIKATNVQSLRTAGLEDNTNFPDQCCFTITPVREIQECGNFYRTMYSLNKKRGGGGGEPIH